MNNLIFDTHLLSKDYRASFKEENSKNFLRGFFFKLSLNQIKFVIPAFVHPNPKFRSKIRRIHL